MSHRKKFSILIVEDNSDWRHALVSMYESITSKKRKLSIDTAASGPEAIRKLRTMKYDLLSLDINLGSTHPKAASDPNLPDLAIPGADGRTVLRKAKEYNACKGVIVLTALDHDEEIYTVMPEDEVDTLRVTLHDFVSEFFPGDRNRIFKKVEAESEVESISSTIPILMKNLSTEKLLLIGSEAGGEPVEIPGPYILECLSPHPRHRRILVISQVNTSLRAPIIEEQENEFLFALGQAHKYDTYVTNEVIEKIYGYKKAQVAIDSVTNRRLKRLGLDPKLLFRPVRGKGRKLHESVTPRKFRTTVSTRGPRLRKDDLDPDAHDPSDFEL